MEELLARGRIYIIVIVFFSSCFLGLMSNVSIPMLAIRSVVITVIVGILSSLFIKYIVSVAKTVSPGGIGQAQESVSPKSDQTTGQNNK
ncbi:MAG: hypothetical protein HZA47_10770 [Planctomycetes bacterium]|uniref:hypothetical protein n=1 Tax=Candidatus Wunengus sp. YC65 TaxID=3367701 RepID=UPI001DEB645B|nr:hypothetical protein [Planctomycetota bacterium]